MCRDRTVDFLVRRPAFRNPKVAFLWNFQTKGEVLRFHCRHFAALFVRNRNVFEIL